MILLTCFILKLSNPGREVVSAETTGLGCVTMLDTYRYDTAFSSGQSNCVALRCLVGAAGAPGSWLHRTHDLRGGSRTVAMSNGVEASQNASLCPVSLDLSLSLAF